MATPPVMTDSAALRALEAISHRRAAFDDPHLEEYAGELPDVLRVLAALRKRGNRSLPPWARQAEFTDVVRLRVWLWWLGADLERWALEGAETAGTNRREVGAILGIRTGQGVVDRRDRLTALFGPDHRPDEKIGRAARRDTRDGTPSGQGCWLAGRKGAVRALATALLKHHGLVDDPDEWLVEVRRDLDEDACTPASFTVLGYAVDAAVLSPGIDALPDTHPLRRAVRDWQALAAQWRRHRDAGLRQTDAAAG